MILDLGIALHHSSRRETDWIISILAGACNSCDLRRFRLLQIREELKSLLQPKSNASPALSINFDLAAHTINQLLGIVADPGLKHCLHVLDLVNAL